MKTCTRCGQTKHLSDFGKHSITKDGLNYWCKECNRIRQKEWAHTPSGMYSAIASRQTFYKKNQEYRYKPVLISREDFIEWYKAEPKICAYCGLPEKQMSDVDDFYNSKGVKLSVDAKDNDVGYICGNLVLACHRCNGIKSDFFSYEEMLEIGQRFVRPKWYIEYISDLGENNDKES